MGSHMIILVIKYQENSLQMTTQIDAGVGKERTCMIRLIFLDFIGGNFESPTEIS